MRPQKLQKQQMKNQPHIWVKQSVLSVFLTLAILCLFSVAAPPASAKEVQHLPHEPNNPKIHQVYFNTTDNREYIYNGQEWVPHDASIDTYVLKKYKKPKNSTTLSDDREAGKKMDKSTNQGDAK